MDCKQDFECQLLEHIVAVLKEMFNLWVAEVLKLFNSLLKPTIITEDEQIPLDIIVIDFKACLKITNERCGNIECTVRW